MILQTFPSSLIPPCVEVAMLHPNDFIKQALKLIRELYVIVCEEDDCDISFL